MKRNKVNKIFWLFTVTDIIFPWVYYTSYRRYVPVILEHQFYVTYNAYTAPQEFKPPSETNYL